MRVVYVTHRDLELAEKAKKELIEQIKAALGESGAADNPISTTVELRGLEQSGRSSDQLLAEILETVQRIDRDLRDERATALQTVLGAVDPYAQRLSRILGDRAENPYRQLRYTVHEKVESPPTDVSGGPKST